MPNYYIGLLSGTSMDGVDAAIVDFSENKPPKLIASHAEPIPELLREKTRLSTVLAKLMSNGGTFLQQPLSSFSSLPISLLKKLLRLAVMVKLFDINRPLQPLLLYKLAIPIPLLH